MIPWKDFQLGGSNLMDVSTTEQATDAVVQQPYVEFVIPDFIRSEPITPDQGVPLQEPDEPITHPGNPQLMLYPVVYEQIFGKQKSDGDGVWKDYKFYKDSQGILYAVCIHCRKATYKAHAKVGTSNAHRHLKSCKSYKGKSNNVGVDHRTREFDQQVYVELMADAIMMHGYPFSIVEHTGFRKVHKYLNPKVKHVSRNTIKKVCILKHVDFKGKLKQHLCALPGKVCLTTDIWSACTSRSYLTLTSHYVDEKWVLCSKVLNFAHFAPPHNGLDTYNKIHEMIKEWGLEDKVFTITCDNATSMDSMVGFLKSTLLENLPCDGKFFHVRCAAHILNLVVKEGLKCINVCVTKIRENVRYIDASERRLIKFYAFAQLCSLACNTKLWLDVPTRWNSTYLMLKKALYYKRGFDLYGSNERHFPHKITSLEWLKVEKICELLEPFYEITKLFSGSDYPTSNLYFYNVWNIERLLRIFKDDGDSDISAMASDMNSKFKKYWNDFSLVISFGVIFDPRFKFDFVKFALKKLNGDEDGIRLANEVYAQFLSLFKYYENKASLRASSSGASSSFDTSNIASRLSPLEEFDACFGATSTGAGETEVDFYFRDNKEPRVENFDVLSFWKRKAKKFPILSSMARDILAIPITSVASESTFSMGGRILNKWRSSLLSRNVEDLVTTRNWLFGYEEFEQIGVEVDDSKSDVEEV